MSPKQTNPADESGGARGYDQAWQPIMFSIFRTALMGKSLAAALTRVDAAAWAAALIIASEWGWR